jgi:HPt (histidine-containing phosphotransfer) domain-containing protein
MCLAAGMNDYLAKPIRVREVLATLYTATSFVEPTPARPPLRALPPPLDEEVLNDLRQIVVSDQPNLLAELIASFEIEAPVLINRLHAGLDQGEVRMVREAAHSLKGSTGNLGALHLYTLLDRMEKLGKDGQLTSAAELMPQVEHEYVRVTQALRAEVEKLAA